MKFKLKISKKRVLQLMFFAALSGIAFLFDIYFEKHPGVLEELQSETGEEACDHGTIYLFSQVNTFNTKSPAQNTTARRYFNHAAKLLQKCHQLRNIQALKAETEAHHKPFIHSCHYLVLRRHTFTFPDDDPPVS